MSAVVVPPAGAEDIVIEIKKVPKVREISTRSSSKGGGGIMLCRRSACTHASPHAFLFYPAPQVPLAAKLVVGAVAGVVGTTCIFPIGTSG